MLPAAITTIETLDDQLEKRLYVFPLLAAPDGPLLSIWLQGKAAATQKEYVQVMNAFYRHVGANLSDLCSRPPLEQAELVSGYAAMLTGKATTKNKKLSAIKSLFKQAQKMGLIVFNVGEVLKLAKVENTTAERELTQQAVDDMLRLEENPRNHAMLTLLYYGGLRVSEVTNLQWRHLQARTASGQITVYGKGKKTRFLLLDDQTWREVWALRGNAGLDDYVFRSRQSRSRKGEKSGKLDGSRVWRIVRDAANRAGQEIGSCPLDQVSPHWLRHANISHLFDEGVPMQEVRDYVGHSSLVTTNRYAHSRPGSAPASHLRRARTAGGSSSNS